MTTSKKAFSPEAPEATIIAICKDILPHWESVLNATVSLLSGGITNQLFKVAATGRDPVLVRGYGVNTEHLIDRDQELHLLTAISKKGFGPKVLGTFANGRIETFLESRPLEAEEMGHTAMIPKIAASLAYFHNIEIDHAVKEQQLFDCLDRWITQLSKLQFMDIEKQRLLENAFDVPSLASDITKLKTAFEDCHSPIVLSHNDLLCGWTIACLSIARKVCIGNILMLKETGKSLSLRDSPITFIDFEYTSHTFRGFDIGNHFNEYAGFDGDFAKDYPSEEQQRLFVREYLQHSAGRPNVADNPTVDELMLEARKFSVLSHLYWGVWSLLQSHYSTINFDFLSYAQQRLEQYSLDRASLL